MRLMGSRIDPQHPSAWKSFKKGLCEGCWAGCCTLPVEASPADLVRLELISPAEAEWPLEDVAERLYDERVIQSFDPHEQLFTLAQVSGRDCVFLDGETRRCTVYEKRPEVCRKFPRIGPRPGFCPHSPVTSE
jgi:Fe-S-cluster containining protein